MDDDNNIYCWRLCSIGVGDITTEIGLSRPYEQLYEAVIET